MNWEERFKLDVWYVDNLSFRLDLYILWKTVATVFAREGINIEGGFRMPDFEGSPPAVAANTPESASATLTIPSILAESVSRGRQKSA